MLIKNNIIFILILCVLTYFLLKQLYSIVNQFKNHNISKRNLLISIMYFISYTTFIMSYLCYITILHSDRQDLLILTSKITTQISIISIFTFLIFKFGLYSLKKTTFYSILGIIFYLYGLKIIGNENFSFFISLISLGVIFFLEVLLINFLTEKDNLIKKFFNLFFFILIILTSIIFLLYSIGLELIYPIPVISFLGILIFIATLLYLLINGNKITIMLFTISIFILGIFIFISNESNNNQYIFKSPNGKDTLIVMEKTTFMGDKDISFYRKKFLIFKECIPFRHPNTNSIYGYSISDKDKLELTWLKNHKVIIKINGINYGNPIYLK